MEKDKSIEALNRSEARIKYWLSVSKEDRIKRARKMAFAKNKKMTPEQKREHAMKMVRARRKKT